MHSSKTVYTMSERKQPQQDNASNRKQDDAKGAKSNTSAQDFDKLMEESDKSRTKKPGSQSSSGGSGRHNNGRGGGK